MSLQRTEIDGRKVTVGELANGMLKLVFDDGEVAFAVPHDVEKYNPNHDDAGRFSTGDGEGGGTLPDLPADGPIVYHGTSQAVIDTIAREGLRAERGKGANSFIIQNMDPTYTEDRPPSVYIAGSPVNARMYAHYAARATGSEPVVIPIRLTHAQALAAVWDEHGGGAGEMRLEGLSIPPSQIGKPAVGMAAIDKMTQDVMSYGVQNRRWFEYRPIDPETKLPPPVKLLRDHLREPAARRIMGKAEDVDTLVFAIMLVEAKTEKWNPWHDLFGRFTTGDGGGINGPHSTTGAAASAVIDEMISPTKISEAGRDSVAFYTDEGYRAVNDKLRKGTTEHAWETAQVDSVIKNLDEVTSVPLPEETTVYRAISPNGVKRMEEAWSSGQRQFIDHGFASTTLNRYYANIQAASAGSLHDGGVVEIVLPKGSLARDVTKWSSVSDEMEVLVKRDSNFKIERRATDATGKTTFHLRLTGNVAKFAALLKREASFTPDKYVWQDGDIVYYDVEKYNEHHDDQGRFASANGEGSGELFASVVEAERFLHPPSSLDQFKNMTQEQAGAIAWYTGEGYETASSILRHGKGSLFNDYVHGEIKHLDEVMAHASLPEDRTVYRGLTVPGARRMQEAFDNGNKHFADNGFLSTSRDPKVANTYTGGFVTIDLPKGTHAFDVDNWSYISGESETLVDRGSVFEITKASRDLDTGKPTFHLKLLPGASHDQLPLPLGKRSSDGGKFAWDDGDMVFFTQKYNLFHDIIGRFTSGDGGGNTVSSGLEDQGGGGGDEGLTGTARWERPREENMRQEYKVEYINHFKPGHGDVFPTEQEFVDALKAAPTVTVDRKLDSSIGGRSRTGSMSGLLSLISGYRSYPKYRNEKTLAALEERVKTGKPLDMPIVVNDGGRMSILSGNTRMDIAFMHNDAVKVVMLDVGKYRKYNEHHDDKGRFAEASGSGADLTGEQTNAIRHYTDTGNQALNRFLRYDIEPVSPDTAADMKHLDSIFAGPAGQLGEFTAVYRGLSDAAGDRFEAAWDDGKGAGTRYLDKGFVSTSLSAEKAEGFAWMASGEPDIVSAGMFAVPVVRTSSVRSVVEIEIPKGGKALAVEPHTSNAKEKEVLINRGSVFRLDNRTVHDPGGGLAKRVTYYVTMMPEGTAAAPMRSVTKVHEDTGSRFVWGRDDLILLTTEKANPNHDERGRFAEGSSGGSGGVTSPGDRRFTSTRPLTQEERFAVGSYTATNTYSEVNGVLRSGYPLSAGVQGVVNDIDTAIASRTLIEPLTVFRGFHDESLVVKFDKAFKSNRGKEFVDKGFVSTSISQSVAQRFTGEFQDSPKYVMRIALPKGTHALDASALRLGSPTEAEVILQRGSRFKLVGKSLNNGVNIYNVKLL